MKSFRRSGLLPVTIFAWGALVVGAPAQTLQISGGSGSGNPFAAPAEKIYSLHDHRSIGGVTESVREFIELNQNLLGTVKPGALSAETARVNLRGLLVTEKNRAFVKAAGAAPRLATVEGLNAAALGLLAHGRSSEAFIVLFLAVEKAADDPEALLNLAGIALSFRRANEALALIGAAERRGDIPSGPWGFSGARMADYLRGYAHLLRGEYREAKAVLARVVAAEPHLREAALALALAEAKLGENPRKSFLLGVWRHRGKLIVKDPKPPAPGEETPGEPDAFSEGEGIFPSMPAIFDVSQGVAGRLARIERPHSVLELIGISSPYAEGMLASMAAASRQRNEIVGPALEAFANAGVPSAYKRRMTSLYNRATTRHGATVELDRAARETDLLREKLDALTDSECTAALAAREPMLVRFAELNNRPGHPTPAELRQQAKELNTTTQAVIDRTARLLENYHRALEQEYSLRSSYMHGMLAHIGAPTLRTALLAEAEAVRFEMEVLQFGAVLNIAHAIGAPEEPSPLPVVGGNGGKGPPCSDDNSRYSLSADFEILSVELTCNSVSIEVEKDVVPELVSLSAELSIETSGNVTAFAGPKAKFPGVGSAKGGAFVTVNKDGVQEVGVKGEVKVSAPTGALPGSYKVGESKISFFPSPDLGPP